MHAINDILTGFTGHIFEYVKQIKLYLHSRGHCRNLQKSRSRGQPSVRYRRQNTREEKTFLPLTVYGQTSGPMKQRGRKISQPTPPDPR